MALPEKAGKPSQPDTHVPGSRLVVSMAPAMAMASLYQATAQAMAQAAQQATVLQHQQHQAAQAVTQAGVSLILSRDRQTARRAREALWAVLDQD